MENETKKHPHDTYSAWKQLYINRLIRRGLSKKEAVENYCAIHDIDHSVEPEIAADDEISYMQGN